VNDEVIYSRFVVNILKNIKSGDNFGNSSNYKKYFSAAIIAMHNIVRK
jgi:hypothetical protein